MKTKYEITIYERFSNKEFTGEFTAESREWAEMDAISFYAANLDCEPGDISIVHAREIE